MPKTEKELAFLRSLVVEPEWTQKFTELFNENIVVDGLDTITYINAGAGSHAIELRDKLGPDTDVFPVCEDAELVAIAGSKAEAVKCGIDFSTIAPYERSDLVVADASFVRPADLPAFLSEALERSSRRLVFYLPTSGSFGEVFSYLWEVFLESGLEDRGAEIEGLITDLKTVSQVEEILSGLDLRNVETLTKSEVFEFETGKDFAESPLVREFLFPGWTGFLDENETGRVLEGLAKKIDEERQGMSFQFALKATLISGEKRSG